ncbi:MBOAT family O-acyltransferase [Pelotomaculum propionicicum]|uniref:Peptidoglycan O-acetyltransferase n=1 Tax=Pelotomaculum propionicicum TaxID=258475 RepID=A0A4Y7RLX2_9FIRM|nr:MBOAT family O-acyltransferase [Pelotomaculum propionicicum]TEB09729.1 Peptidoglycan O-acetyltransferase [Pelotomaculum propionicicum]
MIFNTWVYGAFLASFTILYWTVVPAKGRGIALLVAGLVFYTYYYPAHTALIGGLILATYGLGAALSRLKAGEPLPLLQNRVSLRAVLVAALFICLGVLAYYKYLKLFVATYNDLAATFNSGQALLTPEIVVPLGLSFFIFEFVHYLAETYKGTLPKASLVEYAAFGLFFPTLVAGPIKRFKPFWEQLRDPAAFRIEFVSEGLYRILTGLGKKVIIADNMALFTGPLTSPSNAGGADLWVAVYAFAIKIFFDFAGYSDIAIGSARLLGIAVPENFNRPYLSPNIAAFWNRWHMSLSSWIKDYLYIPLGGNRGTLLFTLKNLMIAMALCGLWHGAAWNFVVWGVYHGAGLCFYRVYRKKAAKLISYIEKIPAPLTKTLSVLATFHYVCLGWVFFATDAGKSFQVIGKLFSF